MNSVTRTFGPIFGVLPRDAALSTPDRLVSLHEDPSHENLLVLAHLRSPQHSCRFSVFTSMCFTLQRDVAKGRKRTNSI